jgi:hypothetical protein
MKIEIDIGEYPQMRHAIETLEIERSRLLKSIRELRSLPVVGEEYPLDRINENTLCLSEIDSAILLVRDCLEAARVARQRERPMPGEASKAKRSKRSNHSKDGQVSDKAADETVTEPWPR